mgnify:FL=1
MYIGAELEGKKSVKESKPFSEVSLEEIARASGGSVRYSDGKVFWVEYANLEVLIHQARGDNGQTETQLREYPLRSIRSRDYVLDQTEVILEEGSVAFVEPARLLHTEEYYSWTTISEKDGFSRTVKSHPQTHVEDGKYIQAARRAQDRLSKK